MRQVSTPLARRAVGALLATMLLALSAAAVAAGEITGNGKSTAAPAHANSICAFSGQEDLQWFFDDDNTMPKPQPTRGEPGHAQSWGQIPKFVRDNILAPEEHPGNSCNGNHGFLAGGH
ncbi:MAG TPA: hypothetical protein VHR55_04975 [Candidatus Limnocylindria bacterium]|nr:hypothetical protein [Candidatus Limnocylindria bacterium]